MTSSQLAGVINGLQYDVRVMPSITFNGILTSLVTHYCNSVDIHSINIHHLGYEGGRGGASG